jgi:HNH endonuclease
MKTCSRCNETKPKTEFYNQSNSKDGLRYHCKVCHSIKAAIYRAENQEKVHDGRVAWATNNRDKLKSSRDAWRLANREKQKVLTADWSKVNPEARRVLRQNYRARKLANGVGISKDIAARLFLLQKGLCPCCNNPLGDNYHLDHIMPLVLGGSNTDRNIQLLRATCNQHKHAKHPIEFMQSRGFLL